MPDPVGNGALRFTNGYPYGHGENGAIVSASTFNAGQGVQITFKTVTYRGDSGGAGKDGADGMSFYLMDATSVTRPATASGTASAPGAAASAYTCSNANPPYDGLVGGYLGLGIDEFGNFLNGWTLEPGYTGATATGDNTALGYGYHARAHRPARRRQHLLGLPAMPPIRPTIRSTLTSGAAAGRRAEDLQDRHALELFRAVAARCNTGTAIADYAPILERLFGAQPACRSPTKSANTRPDGTTRRTYSSTI